MKELKLYVPTYNANYFAQEVEIGRKLEFGDPILPVIVREAEGVRVVLGTHHYWDTNTPDIQIERQPNAWVVFLHPAAGSDACGYVYFLDDGRNFLIKEHGVGATDAITVLEPGEHLPEIDGPTCCRDEPSTRRLPRRRKG
jgi:hypothetical protein